MILIKKQIIKFEHIKFKKMITLKDIENIQKEWGDSLVKLGSLK